MQLAMKSFEIFPKHKRFCFKMFFFELIYFSTFSKQKTVTSIIMKSFLCGFEKLIEHFASAVSVASSNPCLGPFSHNKNFYLNKNLQLKKLNENQIQFHISNKNNNQDQHF